MTMKHALSALSIALVGLSSGAQAAQAEWHIFGSVAKLDAFSSNGSGGVAYTGPVDRIGDMSVGQQFAMDVVLDLTAQTISSVTVNTLDGLLSYHNTTKFGVGGVYPNLGDTFGGVQGSLTHTDNASWPPDALLAGFLLNFTIPAWTGSTSGHTLLELHQALVSGGFDKNVTFRSDLYSAPVGSGKTGAVTFDVSSVVIGAVPEASTWATFACGLTLLTLLRAKQRRGA